MRHCGPGKWLVDFSAGKTELVLFNRFKTGGVYVKMDVSFLEEKSYFKMLKLSFSSKLESGSYIISIAKNATKKIRAAIRSMNFLYPFCCHVSL